MGGIGNLERAGTSSQPQYVIHRIATRPLGREEFGRLQGAENVSVARVPLVDELQGFAERAEDDGVLADVVAGAQGVHADLARRPFADPATQLSVRADLKLIDDFEAQIDEIERVVQKTAKIDDPVSLGFLRTIPGIGKILSLVMLYEIDQAGRFPEVGNFLSYARLVRCEHESAGKKKGSGGKKIGNAHLKWAFSEAACLMLRAMPEAKKWLARQERKRGKKKALSVLEAKIGRTVYHLLRKQQAFDAKRFFAG